MLELLMITPIISVVSYILVVNRITPLLVFIDVQNKKVTEIYEYVL